MTSFIFQHTWNWILAESPYTGQVKTQTSRLVKLGEKMLVDHLVVNGKAYMTKIVGTGTIDDPKAKWMTGKDYCVRPARTAPAVLWRFDPKLNIAYSRRDYTISGKAWKKHHISQGWQESRIRLLDIKRYDVRMIDNQQVRAEGFKDVIQFWEVWTAMHDPKLKIISDLLLGTQMQRVEAALSKLLDRPDRYYDAWMIKFELVQ